MNRAVRSLLVLSAFVLSLAPRPSFGATGDDDDIRHRIKHVFVIVLENEGFDVTFGPNSKAPFLSQTLTSQGVLVSQ